MSDFLHRTLGDAVAVGAVDARSARIWVRTASAGAHELEVWSERDRHAAIVTLAPGPLRDGTTSFIYPDDVPGAPGLEPVTAYGFRLRRGSVIVGEGRFETAPAAPAQAPARFAFAIVSCHEPFTDDGELDPPSLATLEVLDEALRERQVKRVLLMGDQMYADYPQKLSLFDDRAFATIAPAGRGTIHDCTRDEVRALYQRRYHAFWSVEPFGRLLASYPCYPLPDDHEIRDNFGSAPEHATSAWEAIREGALDAFDDYQGQLTAGGSPRRASFDYTLAYGDVGVYGLDVRSQRRHDGRSLRICTDAQFDALDAYLRAASSLQVLMLVTSVPLAIYPGWVASWGARLLGRDSDAGDRWSHPDAEASRVRLTSMLFEHQRRNPHQRVMLLGGDIHIGCAVKFVWRDPSVRPIYQLVSSSVSNRCDALRRKLGKVAPHLDGAEGELWERCEILDGDGENPFDGLNAGVVALARLPDGGYQVTFELLSHGSEAPAGARTVFSTRL